MSPTPVQEVLEMGSRRVVVDQSSSQVGTVSALEEKAPLRPPPAPAGHKHTVPPSLAAKRPVGVGGSLLSP